MKRLCTLLCLFVLAMTGHAQIDQVTLTFSPVDGGSDVTVTASDNGSGLAPDGAISLVESTEYAVTVNLGDDQTTYEDQAEDIQFFFNPSEGLLSGDIQYDDAYANTLPIGFVSTWITTCLDEAANGSFTLQLQDLDGNKSANSTANDGTTVFAVTWDVTVNDDADAPACENEEEIITDVVLTFTPMNGGDVVTARAQDPDGEGVLPLEVIDDIELLESTEYVLTLSLTNEIEGEDITEEIEEEDDEHMFFFEFTDGLMQSPAGDGNADNREDEVNYQDFDDNSLPVGLETGWTTICTEEDLSGTFRIVLKHQPGVKSATSTIDDGSTDVDLTWTLNVSNDADAPSCENEEEIITDVVLTFTPMNGGDVVTARAQDPDGEGVLPLEVIDDIELIESTEYVLTLSLTNEVEGEDITEEIREEDAEHMFFFAFTDGLMQSPAGDGNADNRADAVNYQDFDENSLTVGLETGWTTICTEEDLSGTFRVILKHQPGVKSATSTINDGGTDVDLTWTLNVSNDADAPSCENEEEIITDVVLTFTPDGEGDVITARAQDPDGEGVLPLEVLDDIQLQENTTYTMTMSLTNEIEGEDITEEIREEDAEHMFFFAFTEGIFSSPTGDGNIDNRPDPVNYNDFDSNNLPVGLSTNWTTTAAMNSGTLRIVLKHQPEIKSETSTIDDGGTDVDLTWNVNTVVTNTQEVLAGQNAYLRIQPNPVVDQLQWVWTGDDVLQDFTMRILGANGQVVYEADSKDQPFVSTNNWTPGVYVMQVITSGQVHVQRFVKVSERQ